MPPTARHDPSSRRIQNPAKWSERCRAAVGCLATALATPFTRPLPATLMGLGHLTKSDLRTRRSLLGGSHERADGRSMTGGPQRN